MDSATHDMLSNIALAAAKEASRQTISETFSLFGVNVANFESMQEFKEDVEFVRRYRKISQLTGRKAWTTVVSLASAGVAIALWEWIKTLIKH